MITFRGRLVFTTVMTVLPVVLFASPVFAQLPRPLASPAVPEVGTFYCVVDPSSGAGSWVDDGLMPPMPCPPQTGVVYRVPGRSDVFLADCRAVPRVDAELLQALDSVETLLSAAALASTQGGGGMALMSQEDDPPLPPGGGGGSGGGGEWQPPVYGTNDLWVEVGVTNWLASIVIHAPDNGPWDLLGTTSLSTSVGGLNGTNWAWVLRTQVGETNLVLTNLWPNIGFFRLGTMFDEDSDGLPTAIERLVSHSDPLNPNVDGDAVDDLQEYLQGSDPNRADTDGDGVMDEGFVLSVTAPAQYSAIP